MPPDLLRVAGLESTRLLTSSFGEFMNSIDCFGRSLAVDNAYRHMTSAEQYLLDAQKMQDTAPHTDVADSALRAIDRAKEWLRPYSVSPDNASCRDPPVCVNDDPKMSAIGVGMIFLQTTDKKDSAFF
jgi:hypothetical protein